MRSYSEIMVTFISFHTSKSVVLSGFFLPFYWIVQLLLFVYFIFLAVMKLFVVLRFFPFCVTRLVAQYIEVIMLHIQMRDSLGNNVVLVDSIKGLNRYSF